MLNVVPAASPVTLPLSVTPACASAWVITLSPSPACALIVTVGSLCTANVWCAFTDSSPIRTVACAATSCRRTSHPHDLPHSAHDALPLYSPSPGSVPEMLRRPP